MQSSAMANELIIGIDPDSDKHGVATYSRGKLIRLENLSTIEIIKELVLPIFLEGEVLFSIEDVMANQFVYARNRNGSTANQSKIAMHIGRCQQSQVELMRWLDHYRKPYVLHKPQKQNWAKDKERFERLTGWDKQSNEDGRSAAYFGYLALISRR
jgi:hypothetical protein